MNKKSVAIIGGGAAGMMAGIFAARNGARVTIFDKNKACGKKLTMTGNGKCNFTNEIMDSEAYGIEDEEGIGYILSIFGLKDTLDFFSEIGVEPKSVGGLYYPHSMQAKSVRDALVAELGRLGVTIEAETEIRNITKENNKFNLDSINNSFSFDSCILACGGKSYPKTGSDGNGYLLAKNLGHTIIEPLPALSALEIKDDPLTKASGVRIEAQIGISVLGMEAAIEIGELQITDYGISGIAVMILSNYITRSIHMERSCSATIDFAPDIYIDNLSHNLTDRFKRNENESVYSALIGLLPDKLINVILKKSDVKSNSKCKNLTKEEQIRILDNIKYYEVDIDGIRGFLQAQVTDGGVPLDEIDDSTMESTVTSGLYFAGEMINVTGICGGYNLQWAWTSGYIAGTNAAK